ncbi:MAG: cupredoxin domain-containing protein [Colwellia sp.]
MMIRRCNLLSHVWLVLILLPFTLWAKTKEFHLTIENHVFTPSELKVPANEKVKLIIYNKDKVAEEFDSFDLNREKVLFPDKKTTIYIGPLQEGRYEYFGEYNPNTARGIILVEVNHAY